MTRDHSACSFSATCFPEDDADPGEDLLGFACGDARPDTAHIGIIRRRLRRRGMWDPRSSSRTSSAIPPGCESRSLGMARRVSWCDPSPETTRRPGSS